MRIFFIGCLCLAWAGSRPAVAQFDPPSPGLDAGQILNTPSFPPPAPGVLPGEDGYYGPAINADTDRGNLPQPDAAGQYPPRGRFRGPVAPEVVFLNEPAFPKFWFGAEALYWWTKSSPVPIPLMTMGDPADANPGALGQPGTSLLLGNQNLGIPPRGGTRLKFGLAFGTEQTWAFEATYFSLASAGISQGYYTDGSPGTAVLAFPFYNPTIPGEDASPIGFPGYFAGRAIVTVDNFVQGTDLNLFHNLRNANGIRFDVLGGFRYFNLNEDLNFSTESPNVAPHPAGFFRTFDEFDARNHFYGAQLGLRASYDAARFFFNASGKLALGDTIETVSVSGGTFTNIGGFASAPGAYLSEPTNLGSISRNHFAVMPELNFNVGVRLRPWVSVIAGYSFLYISSVARPGDQLDRTINPLQSPGINSNFSGALTGPARPELSVHSTDFWLQGLNFALEFRF